MRLRDVMTERVKTVPAAATANDAWALMRTHRIHHLVVMEGRDIAGVVSDRDLGGRQGATVRSHRMVSELMTERVVTADPDLTVRKAANLMRGRSIGCLIVTGPAGNILGVVTTADLLDLIGKGAERPIATNTRWALRHRVPHRKQALATGVW
jgi:acetoin utilization protein AcuB